MSLRAVVWCLIGVLAACSAEGTGGGGPSGGDGDTDAGGPGGMDAGGGATRDAAPPAHRDGAAPSTDAACERLAVDAAPGESNVLIVLDRSASMYDVGLLGSGEDRWTPAVEAIRSVTSSLEDRIRFGLMLFPGAIGLSSCGAGSTVVPCGPSNAAAIDAELAGDPSTKTGGGTPIAASLTEARSEVTGLEGDSYVLLVTDGAPNCNESLDGASCRCTSFNCGINNGNCLDDANAVAAVESLATGGVGTYVIGYDTAGWADVLDRMAAAGATGRDRHFPVGDRGSLETVLRDIGGSVVSCSYELEAPPDDIRYVRVTVDGTTVDHESVSGDGNGWMLEGDRTISLVGSACDTLRDGETHDIDIVVECEPVIF